jgi:hypothetical protein
MDVWLSEQPASQLEDLPSPGIAGKSEPSRYKWVRASSFFAPRRTVGARCASFPLFVPHQVWLR